MNVNTRHSVKKIYRKILVIQTAFLGDVILITPLVRALKNHFPDSVIDVLTIPGTAIVFRDNPNVNNVVHFDKRKILSKIFSIFDVTSKIRNQHYDIAFSIQSSMTSSWLMISGGIKTRVGFWRQKFLTIPVRHKKGFHVRERYLKLMTPFTEKEFDAQTELFWSEHEEKGAINIIKKYRLENKSILGIAPGSVWFTKQWPEQFYIELIQRLENDNIKIILFGGKEEQPLCEKIRRQTNVNVVNMAGSLSVLESAALIEKIDLMLCNDSAPLHIANAVKTTVFAFFGPTVRRFGCYPFRENDKMLEIDLYCRPCSKHGGKRCPERHFRCMKDIKPELVYQEIIAYIKRNHS